MKRLSYLIGGVRTGSSKKEKNFKDMCVGDLVDFWKFDKKLNSERHEIRTIAEIKKDGEVVHLKDSNDRYYNIFNGFKEDSRTSNFKGNHKAICYTCATGYGLYSLEEIDEKEAASFIKKYLNI